MARDYCIQKNARLPLKNATHNMAPLRKNKPPTITTPMLPMLVAKPFNRKDWLFEIKWDGYRAIATKQGTHCQLYSRNNISLATQYPTIIEALKKIDHDIVIDGEIVVVDKDGRSQFQLLQNYTRTSSGTLIYYVFDLLFIDGKDLQKHPLIERKKLLQKILPQRSCIKLSKHIFEKGIAFFKAAQKQKLEGIVGKESTSPYVQGRTKLWQKIKIIHEQEAIIIGFTKPKGSRSYFGSLVLAAYKGKKLYYIGNVGSGFTQASLQKLYKRMKPLSITECPLATKPPFHETVTWLSPRLVAQIKFAQWTHKGIMRQPIFLGLRSDKKAQEVHREKP